MPESKPLRLVQTRLWGAWELQTPTGVKVASVPDYYVFMEAWMAAPMGKLEVIPNG